MGCNSSKNLPKNNNDEEPTIRKGDQLTKLKEKESSSNNNNELSSSGFVVRFLCKYLGLPSFFPPHTISFLLYM
jgi:hypothetical protein